MESFFITRLKLLKLSANISHSSQESGSRVSFLRTQTGDVDQSREEKQSCLLASLCFKRSLTDIGWIVFQTTTPPRVHRKCADV